MSVLATSRETIACSRSTGSSAMVSVGGDPAGSAVLLKSELRVLVQVPIHLERPELIEMSLVRLEATRLAAVPLSRFLSGAVGSDSRYGEDQCWSVSF